MKRANSEHGNFQQSPGKSVAKGVGSLCCLATSLLMNIRIAAGKGWTDICDKTNTL